LVQVQCVCSAEEKSVILTFYYLFLANMHHGLVCDQM